VKATAYHKKDVRDDYLHLACPECGAVKIVEDAFDTYEEFGLRCDSCGVSGSIFLPHGWNDPFVWVVGTVDERKDRTAVRALVGRTRDENQSE
jgi:predicted RNA-binding Zn-ribbon protein involved in translation (DUF1610 family)